MQTKKQIQQLLASAGISPNKRLGQHFLIDLNLMQLLADSANINADDTVLEVGCGTGSLTEALAGHPAKIIAVEADQILTKIAKQQLENKKNVEIIHADILQTKHTINPDIIIAINSAHKNKTGRLLLVANLPYNIASPLILNLVTGPTTADAMYVTVQKEVADRMTAKSNTQHYGILSIILSATGDIRIERVLKPTVFWPQPQVDSATVFFLRRNDKISRIADLALFTDTVNLFMGHRRKMLKACTKLTTGKLVEIKNWPQIFQSCDIDPTNRPEQITPEDYIALANLCSKYLTSKN